MSSGSASYNLLSVSVSHLYTRKVVESTMSDGGDDWDSLSGRQYVVEEVVASLPSLSNQLYEFTKELIEAVDETVRRS